MNLRVERREFSPASTIGKLFVNGEFHCWTLEPCWTLEDVKPRAIPEGTYKLADRFSPKHRRNVPHVEGVSGFEEVEIHPGNFPKDTKGCTLVGLSYDPRRPDFIGESQIAFHDLYETLNRAWASGEQIDITYVNGSQAGK